MKTKKIVFFSVLFFFLLGLGYFAFQVWQKRYDFFFQGGELENIQKEEDAEETTSTPTISVLPGPSVSPTEGTMTQEEKIQDILDNHCSQNCRRKVDLAEKKYCLEICGLNQPVEVSKEEDCADLEGETADVCWKNLAIAKKSGAYCDKIVDQGLKESCQNRIIEEFLD